jgi:hypothetical protein
MLLCFITKKISLRARNLSGHGFHVFRWRQVQDLVCETLNGSFAQRNQPDRQFQ